MHGILKGRRVDYFYIEVTDSASLIIIERFMMPFKKWTALGMNSVYNI